VDRDEVAAAIVLFETPREPGAPGLRVRLAGHGGPLAALLAAPPGDPARARWESPAVRAEARARADRLAALGGSLILATDRSFPPHLAGLDWGPAWLFLRGAGALPEQAAAIVGTRRATPSARDFARALAEGVARAGVTVASGLARGIDAAAHRGALETADSTGGNCVTLAVLGTGVDICYPASHQALFAEVCARGLVASEYPPGTPPLRQHFPARNRILGGLCQATVVVQAPARSGALLTSGFAEEAGNEVLAVPGDPLLAENAGSNRLLANGARVALGVEDVLSAVAGHEVEFPGARAVLGVLGGEEGPLPARERTLLLALDLVPRDVDAVAVATGLEVREVLAGLLRLELAGLIESLPGGRVRWTLRAARAARLRGAGPGRPPPAAQGRMPL
jgi:DNA processing protein